MWSALTGQSTDSEDAIAGDVNLADVYGAKLMTTTFIDTDAERDPLISSVLQTGELDWSKKMRANILQVLNKFNRKEVWRPGFCRRL